MCAYFSCSCNFSVLRTANGGQSYLLHILTLWTSFLEKQNSYTDFVYDTFDKVAIFRQTNGSRLESNEGIKLKLSEYLIESIIKILARQTF